MPRNSTTHSEAHLNQTRKGQFASTLLQFKHAIDDCAPKTHSFDKVIERHERYLKRQIKALTNKLRRQPDYARGSATEGAWKNYRDNLKFRKNVLERALESIQEEPAEIKDQIALDINRLKEAFDNGEYQIVDEKTGRLKESFRIELYGIEERKGGKEPWDRYARMDRWYDLLHQRVCDNFTNIDQHVAYARIPIPLRRAFWQTALQMSNTAYDIGIVEQHGRGWNENKLKIITELYTRLSEHPRGANNPHMPPSHKLRHNPAIHSLHVVALLDKIFDRARRLIVGAGFPPKECTAMIGQMQKYRRGAMLAALVHDCGEIEGELSQGITEAFKSEDEQKRFAEERNNLETGIFTRSLENAVAVLNVSPTEQKRLIRSFKTAFHLAEQTDTFFGRLIKVAERIQSQHDYLRFQEVAGAMPLIETSEENVHFSMNYVSKVLYDAHWDSRDPGPKALDSLITDDEPRGLIELALFQAVEEEFSRLMTRQTKAYGVDVRPPKPSQAFEEHIAEEHKKSEGGRTRMDHVQPRQTGTKGR